MRIAATMIVRDEADIIEQNIRRSLRDKKTIRRGMLQ
jgi:hypothetical protein